MEQPNSIPITYHQKGSGTVGVNITSLTNKSVNNETAKIQPTGSDKTNVGIVADLSDKKHKVKNSNYWILPTDLVRQLEIKPRMLGTVGITPKGRIWTKPIKEVVKTWEDKDTGLVDKHIDEAEGKFEWKESGNKRSGKIVMTTDSTSSSIEK